MYLPIASSFEREHESPIQLEKVDAKAEQTAARRGGRYTSIGKVPGEYESEADHLKTGCPQVTLPETPHSVGVTDLSKM